MIARIGWADALSKYAYASNSLQLYIRHQLL